MIVVPAGSARINKLMREQFQQLSVKLKGVLSHARKVTICLDGWSKKNLSSSFLGISACYFDVTSGKPQHAFLNLNSIQHPHTGEMLADCITRSLHQWGITREQVLLVVTDNGANMAKAVRLVRDRHQVEMDLSVEDVEEHEVIEEEVTEQEESDGGESEDEDCEGEDNDCLVLPQQQQHNLFIWLPCMAHTLQLIIKLAYRHYDTLITKTRHVVGRIRKSSVAVEKLVEKCGKTVITDCTTRWNSTHQMINRLLTIKTSINAVLAETGTVTVFTI